MKILLKKYPKGTYKGQQTDGRYIDGYLYDNLKILASKIVNDMTFLGVCFSSTLEVGTGKSVFCTQIGEAWTEIMKDMHGIDVPFTKENLVWRPKELIKQAFKLPKYSFILVDEWEDATYWSELGMSLRQFFRKCRQLNLFMMIIIPNFFQLPMSYAISRSVFAVDVKFAEGFERGFFNFYSFQAKRELYIKGKKEHNYHVVHPNFSGRFLDGYGLPEKEYRDAKLKDMMQWEDEEPGKATATDIKADVIQKIYTYFVEKKQKLSQEQLAAALNLTQQDISLLIHRGKDTPTPQLQLTNSYNNQLSDKEVVWNEEEVANHEQQ